MNDGEGTRSELSAGPRATRRKALLLGVAAAGGAVAAAGSAPTAMAQQRDEELVGGLLALEQIVAVAYEAAIERGLLERRLQLVTKLFRDQEREHVEALSSALRALGGEPRAPADAADVPGLDGARTAKGILGVLIDLERKSIAAYYEAQQHLEDRRLLRTAASIMANEGQHGVVLRQAAGRPPIPSAFATGEE